jgi:hypothetical protein
VSFTTTDPNPIPGLLSNVATLKRDSFPTNANQANILFFGAGSECRSARQFVEIIDLGGANSRRRFTLAASHSRTRLAAKRAKLGQ